MSTIRSSLAALAALSLFAGAALAQDSLQLTNAVFQEIVVAGKDGKKEKKTVPATKIVPGTEVIYVITYRNVGSQTAEKVVISNPLPKELAYRGGSASGKGTKFEVSVDGGNAFGTLPGLRVAGPEGKKRPAKPDDVTHLRWTLAKPVAPGAQGTVSYRATLK
jgi:uncharacterized repeat protein (TIGR01451 family)